MRRFLILALFPLLAAGQVIVNTGNHRKVFSTAAACGTYTNYRVITIPAQAGLSGNLTNYPVLISGTYSYLATVANGGKVQNASGYDVGFFTDNTCSTKLPWETETYTASTGLVNYWVQIPTISKTASVTFVLAYNNASISTDQSNPTGTWPSTFQGVYHLPNGTTLTENDSTINANNGSNSSATATTGEIDGASAFNGSAHITLNANGNLIAHGSAWSSETWVNATSLGNAYNCTLCEGETLNAVWAAMIKSNGKLALYTQSNSGTSVNYDGTGSHTLLTGTWYLIAMTYDSSAGLVGYVNGASDGTGAAAGVLQTGVIRDVALAYHPSIAGRNLTGSVDEARVANTALSADWILTDYNSQSSPATFYSVGTEH